MTQEFSFIFDGRIQKILERDYAEVQRLDLQTSTKSVIVLSGGIIEGLLFDALVASGEWSFKKACRSSLIEMIGSAKGLTIIEEDRLSDVTRRYRNLIHPGKEVRDSMVFEEADAISAKAAVDIVIQEVRQWSEAEQRHRRLRSFLARLYQEQKDFLQLFANPKPPDANQYEHPFLSHRVYTSIPSLIENKVLERESANEPSQSKERVRLVKVAIALVEELIIKGNRQRDSITLDYANIAVSGASGSGAPPSNPFVRRRR
jgi:hypothetical protein